MAAAADAAAAASAAAPSAHLHAAAGVILGNLVVVEGGGVGRRHEAPVHLGVDLRVLPDLAVRELDFERLAALVVADRAQLRGIDALSLHHFARLAVQAPPPSISPSMRSPFTRPL